MNKDDLRESIIDIPNASDVDIDEEIGDDGKFNFSFKMKNSKYFCVGLYTTDKKRIKWIEINALVKAKEDIDIEEYLQIVNEVNQKDLYGCATAYIEEISAVVITCNMLVLPNVFYSSTNRLTAYKAIIMEAIVAIYEAVANLKKLTKKCHDSKLDGNSDRGDLSLGDKIDD